MMVNELISQPPLESKRESVPEVKEGKLPRVAMGPICELLDDKLRNISESFG
jgi:hypothetical protein